MRGDRANLPKYGRKTILLLIKDSLCEIDKNIHKSLKLATIDILFHMTA